MKPTNIISINIMGDVTPTEISVSYLPELDEYEFRLTNHHENTRVKFSPEGEIVQTFGIPLDSNTLRDVSRQLKKETF